MTTESAPKTPQAPTFEFLIIRKEDVPKIAQTYFERKAVDLTLRIRRGEEMQETKEEFPLKHFFMVKHDNGDRTYLAQHEKVLNTTKDTESNVYLVDMREDKAVGYGEIISNLSDPVLLDEPYVGYTTTVGGVGHTGLGTRRLLLMNDFAKKFFGYPLHAGNTSPGYATATWLKLVKEGYAVAIRKKSGSKFAFKSEQK